MRNGNAPLARPYGRLKLLGAGVVLAAFGGLRMAGDIQVVAHWTGQPVFSWGLVAAGGLCVLLAVLPTSWIVRASALRSRSRTHEF